MKGKNMKITTTLMAATLGIALFAAAAYAQKGNDGITASPKLRETLNATTAIAAQPTAPAEHRCAMCKDEYTTSTDQTAKGVLKPTVLVLKHLCPGCETTASVQGQGKAAYDVVTHKCTLGTAQTASCCGADKPCCVEKNACCAAKEACCAPKT